MPAKTGKQYRLMAAACHGDVKGGPSKKVACEMVHKTPPAKRATFMKSKR